MNQFPNDYLQDTNRRQRILQRYVGRTGRVYTVTDGSTPQDILSDWKRPRYALPSLSYLSPFKAIQAFVYAAVVLSILTMASWQLLHAYISKEGLDISSSGYIGPAIMFLVAAVGAATQLRHITLRLALRRQARRQTVTPEYRTELSPVEAGVMIDAYSSTNEATAVVRQLLTKGNLHIERVEGTPLLVYDGSSSELSIDERVCLDGLFGGQTEIALSKLQYRLDLAGKKMAQEAYKRLMANGNLPVLSGAGKIVYFVLRSLSFVGAGISVLLFSLLFNPESYIIGYPRYPVYAWQMLFIALLIAIVLFVPLQAYFSSVFSKSGLQKYREAAGLYMYIETVLKGRFEGGNLAEQEVDYYLPYAQAFGIEDSPLGEIDAAAKTVYSDVKF